MKTYAVGIGLVVRHGERTWRLERQLEDNTLVFSDQITGTPRTMTLAELQRDVLAGKLAVVTGDSSETTTASGGTLPLVKTLDDLPEHVQAEIRHRLRYVTFMRKKGLTRGMRNRIRRELQQLDGKLPPRDEDPSVIKDLDAPRSSAVMDWMRRYELSGGNPLSLGSRHATRHTPKRINSRILSIAREKVRTFYCNRSRPSIEQTRIQINKSLAAAAADGAKSISLSTVRRLITEIDPYQRDVARFGLAYARNKWRYSLTGIGAQWPMQRYEIDHTTIDVVAISDATGMPLGRPTITIVIDAFSGYIVGFFISFWGTGLAATLAALKVAMLPKDDYDSLHGLSRKWLGYGIPMLLVVDNGLEFHSPQFHSVAMHLNMDLRFCAVRQPWLKPFVERALNTYNGYLPFEGRVDKPLNNYLPLDARKTARITFSSLCLGLMKAFVEIHPFEINERKLILPYDAFSEGMNKSLPPLLPSSTAELDIIVGTSKELTVGNEGVVTNYLRFNSVELQNLRRSIGLKFRTLAKFNPEDLSSVFVQDPVSKGWLTVPSCQPEYTDGLSLVQHKAIRSLLKDGLSRRQIPEELERAKWQLADIWAAGAISGKKLKTAHLRAMSGLTSSHAIGGVPPQRSAAPAPEAPPKVLIESDLKMPELEIPMFDSFDLVTA